MAIRYSSLPDRTRAMFDRKLAARHLTVRDFNRPAVDDSLRRAASLSGDEDSLSPHEAEVAAADLQETWDEAWDSYRLAS
jgi:hypothetical protein